MIATWDEWTLLILASICWCRVVILTRRAHVAHEQCKDLSRTGDVSARAARLVSDYYNQERLRFFVATLYVSAGIAAVLVHPPPPNMTTSARWKLWVIIIATALLWRQSEQTWRDMERRRARRRAES